MVEPKTMTEKIEYLAEFFDWGELKWKNGRIKLLEGKQKNQNTAKTFPPSKLDGNGLLWLISESNRKGIVLDLHSFGIEEDTDNSRFEVWCQSKHCAVPITRSARNASDLPVLAVDVLLKMTKRIGWIQGSEEESTSIDL